MDINAITHAIMFGDLTNEQLSAVSMAVKYRRGQLTITARRSVTPGSKVKFVCRNGTYVFGDVTKINRKTVIVRDTRPNAIGYHTTWRVPASMLESV